MRITGSRSRLRIAALVACVAGGISFAAAQDITGRGAVVIAAISFALFLLEIALGIADGPRPPERR